MEILGDGTMVHEGGCQARIHDPVHHLALRIQPQLRTHDVCRLCYFSDFGSYELHGQSVSDSGYILANGGPEPAGLDNLLDDLSRRKLLRTSYHHGSMSYATISLPDISLLTPRDIECIDGTIARYGGMSERLLSWMSREDAPCVGKHPSDALDYSTVHGRCPRTSAKALQGGEA